MQKSKRLIFIFLILALFFSGCKQSKNLQLKNSNLEDYNLNGLNSKQIKKIKLKYNQPLTSAQVSITENKSKFDDFNKKLKKEKLTLSNFNLQPGSVYNIVLTVTNKNGQKQINKINFTTQRTEFPKIEKQNPTLLQGFYWYLNVNKKDTTNDPEYKPDKNYGKLYPKEKDLWDLLAQRAPQLSEVGINQIWLPPAHKGHEQRDEGYGVYDIWDLGEFKQQGTTRTKYGTRQELDHLIETLHQHGIKAYYDIVMNHRIGGKKETVKLEDKNPFIKEKKKFKTKFSPLKGRQKYYSKAQQFQWNWQVFDGMPHYLFKNKEWDQVPEKDALLGADIDYQNPQVQHELKEWGAWIINDIGFDGFRIDAIKHVHTPYMQEWLRSVQNNSSKEVFFVGEAWMKNVKDLTDYLNQVNYKKLSAFDFPLRYKFSDMSRAKGDFNLAQLSSVGLVNQKSYQHRAVTFIDNHDLQRDNSDPGIENYELQAYAYILMRKEGIPTVFYKDYYHKGIKNELNKLLTARKYFAYGPSHEVNNNDQNVYSYVREGLSNKENTGLVMMISDGQSGATISKQINSHQPNTTFYDFTGNIKTTITTDNQGQAQFKVKANPKQGYSIWVPIQ